MAAPKAIKAASPEKLEIASAKQAAAKAKYGGKVCETYLGIDASYCEGAFKKLLDKMKAGIIALSS